MKYECTVCGHIWDEEAEGVSWEDLPDDWVCPICAAEKDFFEAVGSAANEEARKPTEQTVAEGSAEPTLEDYLGEWRRTTDDVESHLTTIQQMAIDGETVIEPMRTRKPLISWDEILVKGAQLMRVPLNEAVPIAMRTVIGPEAEHPLVIETPVFVSHMSFGALSKEAKIALAMGSAAAETAMCSGEGGILPESLAAAHRYVFEYVPNRYSVTEENLRAVDAVEIKIGQSVKPGMGGHLPGSKVTDEIAAVRGFPAGQDIMSPACFDDISDAASLGKAVSWLRRASGGKPIGVKVAAGHIEADLAVALEAGADFVTVDGRGGATGAAPKVVKDATSVPTIYALARARRFLDEQGAGGVSLVITGGFRVSSDVVKALAMGADAVALASAAMIAAGCQQYRICQTGKCPVGIATQDPALRARFDIELSARRVENFFRTVTEELRVFARLTGHHSIHDLGSQDLCTTSTEIANHTKIEHAGGEDPAAKNI